MGSSSSKINNIIIWIDQNIDNDENKKYIKELESIKNTRVDHFKEISDSLETIKKIKFEETHIIVSGLYYSQFIKVLKENIRDIYIIPKIIIFTKSKENFLKFNPDYKDNSFYSLGGIKTKFEEIKSFLFNPPIKKFIEEKNSLTFEYIDCNEKLILPLFYKSLIEITSKDNIEKYTEHLYNKFSEDNKEVINLLNSIRNIKDIPIELLSKYYARLYTFNSKFYKSINKDLRDNKRDDYMQYIKILYEGVKLKSLPLASNKVLYRGSKITNNEIEEIKKNLDRKKEDLPGVIVFSKSFLSFTKDEIIARSYLDEKEESKNKNLFKVLYTIEKDDNLNYDLSTHCDIENISEFPNEREVLFLPFSSFEIKDLKETIKYGETVYEIKLLYLGKYLKELENIDYTKITKIPDSDFKKEIVGLIPKQKMENTKEVVEKFKKYKNIVNNNLKSENEINIIYNINNTKDINDENKIRIFGEYFVKNNSNKAKIIIENKEYDLIEYFNLKDYTNNKLTELHIKLKNINEMNNLKFMFSNCSSLSSLPDISKLNTNNVTNMSYMFRNCSSLSSLPDISKWNINNVNDMSGLFYGCSSLKSLPDISKWNTKNVKNMNELFYDCSSLSSLPDISNWDANNVTNMSNMFYGCSSIVSLPDLSKWNTNNVTDMSYMFRNCSSLLSLPVISNWNTKNVIKMSYMFYGCSSLSSLPDLSKWNINNVKDKSNMFFGCDKIIIPKQFI